jgi:hypothetical protein
VNSFFWVFFAALLVLVIVGAVYAKAQAQKRTRALEILASQIGFIFHGDDWSDPSQAPQLGTALFNRGSGRRFDNIMTGEYGGLKVSIFDYRYTVSSGKSAYTYTQTVAVFAPQRLLPLFELRPEGFFDRVGDVFMHKDIDFDSNPEFSRRYLLRGPEPENIRALFSPALLAFFEGFDPEQKWHVEGNGDSLLFYRSNAVVDAEQILSFRDQTAALAQSFFKSCGAIAV